MPKLFVPLVFTPQLFVPNKKINEKPERSHFNLKNCSAQYEVFPPLLEITS